MHQNLTKNQIRDLIRIERKKHSKVEIDVASRKICESISTFTVFQNASTLFLYAALPLEVQTKELVTVAKCAGKKIAFPKISTISQEMEFYVVDDLESLEVCTYGKLKLLEPKPEEHKSIIPNSNDLMIVPGVAFDHKKHRIGYGGGYYDRYLAKYPVYTIGVGFEFQLLGSIEVEAHDIMLRNIVTDRQIIV